MRTKPKLTGRYVVTDARVCHGQPTFRGTRILVADVLEQVANGMAWDAIVEEWRGNVSPDAIAEAVRLAREALITQPLVPARMTGS
jgi:uncharacterized protein (DUF433 family)